MTLIIVSAIVLIVATMAVLKIFVFGFKGQKVDEVDINAYGTSTEIRGNTKGIDECEAKEAIYICNATIKDMPAYCTTISGSVTALGGMYNQSVYGEKYVSGNAAVYISKSTSSLVSVGKKILIENKETVYIRDAESVKNDTWSTTLEEYEYDDYIADYGIDFRELTNYVVNDQTIISASLISTENSTYTYSIVLDEEKATLGYRVNMAKMGNLPSLPKFNSCRFEITINENFEPIEMTCYDNYKVEKLGGLTCTSTLRIVFNTNEQMVELPNI